MIIGSKLQNKCTEFKKTPSSASSVDVMTLLHTPQAQCDIHTNQTQALAPSRSISAIHLFAYLICIISRFFKKAFLDLTEKETINRTVAILFFYYKQQLLNTKVLSPCKSACGEKFRIELFTDTAKLPAELRAWTTIFGKTIP